MSPRCFVHALMASGMGACLFSYLINRYLVYDVAAQTWSIVVFLLLLAVEVYMYIEEESHAQRN